MAGKSSWHHRSWRQAGACTQTKLIASDMFEITGCDICQCMAKMTERYQAAELRLAQESTRPGRRLSVAIRSRTCRCSIEAPAGTYSSEKPLATSRRCELRPSLKHQQTLLPSQPPLGSSVSACTPIILGQARRGLRNRSAPQLQRAAAERKAAVA